MPGSRVMSLNHRGSMVWVREGHDGECRLEFDNHTEMFEGKMKDKFPPACRYALKWLLENGGQMKGDYERSSIAEQDQRDRSLGGKR